jgi:hypothetical protein
VSEAVRDKWTSDRASNMFYCKVPLEQVADVRGKGNYPLRSMMSQLEYLIDAPFKCDLEDVNMAAFAEATSIIRGHDVVEEFLACGIWPLSKSCEFDVEKKETPLSNVMVPMPKVNPIIAKEESEAAFEARIIATTNLLVDNYCIIEHNAYTRLQNG